MKNWERKKASLRPFNVENLDFNFKFITIGENTVLPSQ